MQGDPPTSASSNTRSGALRHSAFDKPVTYTIEQRPPGDDDEANTAQTVDRMRQYIRADSLNPLIRTAAHRATAAGAGDVRPLVFSWIRSHVEFTSDADLAEELAGDPAAAEVLIRPVDLLSMRRPQGDCDDQAMLCAAMLRALGVETWLKTVAADPDSTDRYSHVYVMADGPGGAIALDCSHGPYPGWEATAVGKTKLWPVEQGTQTTMDGLGFDWGGLINTGMQSATQILGARYAVPQMADGQTIRRADGTIMSQLPYGTVPAISQGVGSGMLLLIVAGLAVVLIATRK